MCLCVALRVCLHVCARPCVRMCVALRVCTCMHIRLRIALQLSSHSCLLPASLHPWGPPGAQAGTTTRGQQGEEPAAPCTAKGFQVQGGLGSRHSENSCRSSSASVHLHVELHSRIQRHRCQSASPCVCHFFPPPLPINQSRTTPPWCSTTSASTFTWMTQTT